jgi:hypothetical protein
MGTYGGATRFFFSFLRLSSIQRSAISTIPPTTPPTIPPIAPALSLDEVELVEAPAGANVAEELAREALDEAREEEELAAMEEDDAAAEEAAADEEATTDEDAWAEDDCCADAAADEAAWELAGAFPLDEAAGAALDAAAFRAVELATAETGVAGFGPT